MRAAIWLVLFAGSAFAQAPIASNAVAKVFVFTTTDCPISNRYAPEIERLAKTFSPRVSFTLVYPVPTDTPALIAEHQKKFAFTIPFMRDNGQVLVKQTGATVTPEAVVQDRNGKTLYRGRIDDRYVDFGKERAAPTTHDLEDALAAVIAGQPVKVRETKAVGCYLTDLIK
jgi:hypothetical protein